MTKRIRIVNTTGVGADTVVTDADTGEAITDVMHISLHIGAHDDVITAEVTHMWPIIDVIAALADDKDIEKIYRAIRKIALRVDRRNTVHAAQPGRTP